MRLNEGTAQVEMDLAGRKIIVSFYRLAGVDDATNRRSEWRLGPIRRQFILPECCSTSVAPPLHHFAVDIIAVEA